MDIFFQARTEEGKELGERQDLRCRGIYHAMNDWCTEQGLETPESGQRIQLDAKQWAAVAPKIKRALVLADDQGAESEAMAEDWLTRIRPQGAAYVEYWFTV